MNTSIKLGLGLLLSLPLAALELPEEGVGKNQMIDRTIIGYGSDWTVRPGDTLDIMVSTLDQARTFSASLVKVVNGDDLTRYHDLLSLPEVEATFADEYQGQVQHLNLGSYVQVENTKKLDKLKSFTVAAWIYPTFDPTEYTPPDLNNIDPFSPPTLNIASSITNQTIVSRFDETTNTGWALQLNENFQLEFLFGDKSGNITRIHTDEKINDWAWTYAAVSYDEAVNQLSIYALEKPYAPGDQFTARNLHKRDTVAAIAQQGPLRIAATRAGTGAARADFEKPGAVFQVVFRIYV